jgi:hypothetical protein
MFAQFSEGYYLTRLYVEPGGERPAINRERHRQVNEQLYADDDGLQRLDAPLVMKLGPRHLAVEGDGDVPEGTLSVPRGLIEDPFGLPETREVLLARAETAERLARLGMPAGR